MRQELENVLEVLHRHAWEHEIQWPQVLRWLENFRGEVTTREDEQLYALYALSRFMYFGRRLIREMLRSLYRDYFESPIKQHLRRQNGDSLDVELINDLYKNELRATRFLGIGNPAESGAHLLYYFRQVNNLPKNLFADLSSVFQPQVRSGALEYLPRDFSIKRYVFFDDLVGSGTQIDTYLSECLSSVHKNFPDLEISYLCLFGTRKGIDKANEEQLFRGKAKYLFFLDDSFKAFEQTSRYFSSPPHWFEPAVMRRIAEHYGQKLSEDHPLGYKEGQLFLSFSHNTPDNAPPIFWDDGHSFPWNPLFTRFDKNYKAI